MKKILGATLSLVLACALCVPALSFAETAASTSTGTETSEHKWLVADHYDVSNMDAVDTPEPIAVEPQTDDSQEAASVTQNVGVGDCTATIKYYENITYPDPEFPPPPSNQYLLGTRTITGLTAGQVLDAWDYVVDIEGFFFFDGWPGRMTVSTNPEENVFEFFYFRTWNSSYTVNYYLMVGADLTASTWSDALAPEGVEFIKLGSETFENQPYGALIKGDAYEYRIDGTYVVDTYPAQIRVGTDVDNETLNVLYVPDSANLPDNIEIPDDVFSVDGDDPTEGEEDSSSSSSASTATPSLPEDGVFSKDEIAGLLPDGMTIEEAEQLFKDFIGSAADAGELEITDEMLAHPVNKEEALKLIEVYRTGYEQGMLYAAENAVDQPDTSQCDHNLCIVVAIILLILGIIGYVLYVRERKFTTKLQKELDKTMPEVKLEE